MYETTDYFVAQIHAEYITSVDNWKLLKKSQRGVASYALKNFIKSKYSNRTVSCSSNYSNRTVYVTYKQYKCANMYMLLDLL